MEDEEGRAVEETTAREVVEEVTTADGDGREVDGCANEPALLDVSPHYLYVSH